MEAPRGNASRVRYVVIMAGGSGTRFWPASRRARPKQFLKIGSERSLLAETAARLEGVVPLEHLFVVTGASHAEHARDDLPGVPAENVLVEPTGRNTAPCIGWATRHILAKDPDARIAVLPADHYIRKTARFAEYLNAAFEAASERIVLFGIIPDRPETGYGYIRQGARTGEVNGEPVHEVDRFVEKPDAPTAERYLAEGGFLWNAGMFVFPARVMDEEISAHVPELAKGLDALDADPSAIDSIYPTLPKAPIDTAVMEPSSRTLVMPAEFGWSDVGSWDAAKDVYDADADGNVALGDVMLEGVKNAFVDARAGRKIAVVGLDDVVVVDTPDALLVMRRGQSQDVKKVVERLEKNEEKDLL